MGARGRRRSSVSTIPEPFNLSNRSPSTREEEFLKEHNAIKKQRQAMEELWKLSLQSEQVYFPALLWFPCLFPFFCCFNSQDSFWFLLYIGVEKSKGRKTPSRRTGGPSQSPRRV